MHKKTIAIIAICVLYFSACTALNGDSDSQRVTLAVSSHELDFANMMKIPRIQSDFDLGFGSQLIPDGDIWAIGGWNTRGNYIYLWSAKDNHWSSVKLPVNGISVSAGVHFTNPQSGWVISGTMMLRTRDGGQSWKSIPLDSNSKITRLQALSFRDSENGIIAGETGYMDRTTFEPIHGVKILCTTNGGDDFRICYKDKVHSSVLGIINLKNVSIALIDGSDMLITPDGGKSWTEKGLPAIANATGVDNQDIIWIVGDRGAFFSSQDLGNSWDKPEIDLAHFGQIDWNSIAFGENGFGIAVGNGGLFAVSVNGHDWHVTKPDHIEEDLYSIQIHGSNVLVEGKNNLYKIGIRDLNVGTDE